jgi:hypothetical protein
LRQDIQLAATAGVGQPTRLGRNSHYDKKVAGPAWDDEVESERARANLASLAASIPAESNELRSLPTANLARSWHREMPDGVDVPDDAYRGGFRGDDHPALIDYEVTVGGLPTTRACDVSNEIRNLMTDSESRVTELDDLDARADQPCWLRTSSRRYWIPPPGCTAVG